jgi:hypothetical protein
MLSNGATKNPARIPFSDDLLTSACVVVVFTVTAKLTAVPGERFTTEGVIEQLEY